MSADSNGGPAFPLAGKAPGEAEALRFYGMSLRDYFAAAAMEGLIASFSADWLKPAALAERAYGLADAMLKARDA